MTTKTLDSTVSEILQDNSSVEYVEPQKNPIATIPNETQNCVSSNPCFNFHAEHNGEACIESLKPEDAHTPNAFRFTIAMLCTIYNVAERTMRDNIDSLLEDEEIAYCDISQYAIPGGNNRTYETTLYNLTVLNRLGMCCFRKNKEAKKVRDKFNDVLVKHETQAQPTIYDYARALIAEKERSDALEAQNKALTAERDEAIRTKTQYQSNLAAQMSGRVGGLTSALNRARTENAELKEENVTLKDGWWSVSDVARMIARVCKLPRVYSSDTLNSKCRIGLRYFAAKRNRMTRMLEVDGTHQDQYGNLVQNTAEHFDEQTVANFREWVDENPDLFPKIKSVLVITMNDEKSENA